MGAPQWGLLSCGLLLVPWLLAVPGITVPPEPELENDGFNNTLCTEYHCCPEQSHPKRMDCSYRDLSLLRQISVPTPIISLSLQHNLVSRLERGAFVWAPSLLQLDFSNNNITAMSRGWWLPDIRKRNSSSVLKRLSLANNLLRLVISDSFEGLETLERLDLSYNRIRTLQDDSFTRLCSLEQLAIDHNPLYYIRNSVFAPLSRLRVLQMNHLGHVTLPPNAFRFVAGLSTLGLAGNNLTHMPLIELQDLVLLESLDLSESPFTKLSPLFLRGLPVLKTLRLDNLTQLSRVEAGAFGDLPNLKELHLSYNSKLTEVHPEAFSSGSGGHTASLRELHLRHSGLPSLPPRLQDWGTLQVLDLSENAWNCDCKLRWMAAVAAKLPPAFKPICTSPRSVKGKLISDLLPHEFSCEDDGRPDLASSLFMLCGIIGTAAVTFFGVIVYNRCTPVQMPDYSVHPETDV